MTTVDRGPEYREKVERFKRNMIAAAGRRDPVAHVIPVDDEWLVKRNGYLHEEASFPTRDEAYAFAKTLSGIDSIHVHGRNFQVVSRDPV